MSLALAQVSTAPPDSAVLARIDDLRGELEHPDLAFADVTSIRDRAEVLHAAARAARLGLEASNSAKETQIRAERRCGLLLLELMATWSPHPVKVLPNRMLGELGVSNFQSSRYQRLARIESAEFEQRLAAVKDAQRELTIAIFVRAARRYVRPVQRRGTPTGTLLSNALHLLCEVRGPFRTPREITVVREIARVSAGWLAQLDEQDAARRETGRSVRIVSCLLCGRQAPSPRPARCPACRGAWIET